MIFNVLSSSSSGAGNGAGSWVLMAIMLVAIVVLFIVNSRSQKKKQKEAQEMLDAIKPGNKVKTIGGICGIVVEICPDDGTFVLQTGTEASGKSFIKFDRQAVYQTDAVVKKDEPKEKVEEQKEAPVEVVEEPAVETEEKKED